MATGAADGDLKSSQDREICEEEHIFPLINDDDIPPVIAGEGEDEGHVGRGSILREGEDDFRGGQSRGILTRNEAEEELELFDEEEEEGEEEEEEDGDGGEWEGRELRAAPRRQSEGDNEESDGLPSPMGLPGTTPPAGGRYMKHTRKGHKYKGGKKLSLGHIPKCQYRDTLKKRPKSMMNLHPSQHEEEKGRRYTAPAISVRKCRKGGVKKVGEERGRRRYQRSPGGVRGHQSPHHAGGHQSPRAGGHQSPSTGGHQSPHARGHQSPHTGGHQSPHTGGHQSPHHTVGDGKTQQKQKKKHMQRMISQDRDDKTAKNPPIPLPPPQAPPPPVSQPLKSPRWRPPLIPVQSVDLPDYTPSLSYLTSDVTSDDLVMSSLHLVRPPQRSSSAGLHSGDALGPGSARVYRSYSDAHVSLPSAGLVTGRQRQPGHAPENIVCPPDRKQFFRRFQKALKYAAGISRPQPHPPETPYHPHMSRYHSENLAMENPQAHLMEDLWNEIQAYLHGRQPEEQMEWLQFNAASVDKVLTQIVHFQIAPTDPLASLNTAFLAAPDYHPGIHGNTHREGYAPLGEGGEGEEGEKGGSTDSSTVMCEERKKENSEEEGSTSDVTTSLRSQPWSVDSADDGPQLNKTCPQEFLSAPQISAVTKVCELLERLETVESLYQNRHKVGNAHPQYRTLSFRRKVDALTLWLKVTKGLAQALATLSGWLGVTIILPEMCRDEGAELPSRSTSNESKVVTFAPDEGGDDEGPGELIFSVGSPKEGIVDPEQSLKRFTSRGQSSSGGSVRSRGTLQRMFSSYQSMSIEGGMKGPYRGFVDRVLKKNSLSSLLESVQSFISPVQQLCVASLTPVPCQPEEDIDDASQELEKRPLLRAFLAPATSYQHMAPDSAYHRPTVTYERTISDSTINWVQEFDSMNLPHFGRQYIQLVHTPLDVMHECLKLQLGLQLPEKPSPLSVKQLVYDCRDTLKEAIKVRKKYREVMEVVTNNDHSKEQVDLDIEFFEADLKKVLMIYFNYLQKWVRVSSGHILEEEWRHVKQICAHIRSGEPEAGRRFCDMAARLLDSTGDMFQSRMDENCHIHHNLDGSLEERRAASVESCRLVKELFVEVRERASKAIGFAKMLRKDLEIAADFSVVVHIQELLDVLKASDHAQVVLPSQTGKMIFVPEHMTDSADPYRDIQQLLSVSFAHSDPSLDLKDSYLLLVAMDTCGHKGVWTGQTLEMKASAETTIAVSEMQIECLKMIVASSAHLASSRTSFLNAVGKAVTLTNEQTSSHENVATRIHDLKHAACKLADQLIKAANQVEDQLCLEVKGSEDKTYQAAMHACFNLGFEYIRDVFRLVGEELAYRELGDVILEYAELWMRFVLEKCERGRGTRPRWASMGLDFLMLACTPRQLAHISPSNFESLRKLMNRSLEHVVGEAPPIMGNRPKFTMPPVIHRRSPRVRQKKPPILVSSISDPRSLGLARGEDKIEGERGRGWPPGVIEEEEMGEKGGGGGVGEGEGGGEELEEDILPAQLRSTPSRVGPRVTFQSDMGMELEGGVVHSPPVSTESVSSGHHSPPVSHDDPLSSRPFISTCIATPSHTSPTPSHISPSPHIHISPYTVAREESNTSTASATSLYGSPYFSRSPSGGSLSGGESGNNGDRLANIQKKIKLLELNRQEQLRNRKMIGRVKTTQPSTHHHPVRLSSLVQTHFKWQRGRKLGEGRFGKVYECRNLDTGEMMAVKQMSVQEKDTGTLQTICDEIGIFQKVSHENIVQFHGLEVYHTELYLFMEYCHEGTLWSIAQQGLPEHMIRRYTRDLLRAVDLLHSKGIIHRDIKGANIFLSNDSIKLGDFGLSVQLKNLNKTMPNEIRQQVGTVPYLSPEVVLKHEMGRPLDIWSVGCVVVEMATGKLPWAEHDNQYQIMFQLGTGKSPPVSSSALCDEGHEFLSHCFQSSPNERWRASQLLTHHFVKVSDED